VPDYTPHTPEELEAMCSFLGIGSEAELFAAIPAALQVVGGLDLPDGAPEPDVLAHFSSLAARNAGASRYVCFAGAGAYDHEIPPVVRALGSRSEFVTAYTPYQPEVAQGVLQAIFEYQTLVARLAGLPIANASLYDGATALVEALNLGCASAKNEHVWLSSGVHPHWRATAATFARGTGHQLHVAPLVEGRTDFGALADAPAPGVIVVASPNYLGALEDIAAARRLADQHGAVLVACADPIMASVLKTPGSQGADVVVGEGQPLGTALSFGGPYLGLFACTEAQLRRLPGRLVGETVDVEGRRAFVTTLRAREQDIRREKATSNVCSNQTLMAVTAAIQLGWLGTQGLAEVAGRSVNATRTLRDLLGRIDGVEPLLGEVPTARDVPMVTPISAEVVLERLADEGFVGGLALSSLLDPGDPSVPGELAERTVLMAATEKRTLGEIEAFASAFTKAVAS
jgi:glycine dehydrogenase subunit 1